VNNLAPTAVGAEPNKLSYAAFSAFFELSPQLRLHGSFPLKLCKVALCCV